MNTDGLEKYLDQLGDGHVWRDFHFDNGKFSWNHAFLGVSVQDLSDQLRKFFKAEDNAGVLVSDVVKNSPADEAGIQAGDVIIAVDDAAIESPQDLTAAIGEYDPNTQVTVHLIRDGKSKNIKVKLAENKDMPLRDFSMKGFKSVDPSNPHFWFQPDSDFQKQLNDMRSEIDELRKQLESLKQQ